MRVVSPAGSSSSLFGQIIAEQVRNNNAEQQVKQPNKDDSIVVVDSMISDILQRPMWISEHFGCRHRWYSSSIN